MTIPSHLDPSRLNASLEAATKLAESDPDGVMPGIVAAVGDATEEVRRTLKAAGFDASGTDPARVLETVIWWYFLASNRERCQRVLAETAMRDPDLSLDEIRALLLP